MTFAVAIAALLLVAWLTREALARSDRASRAEIAQANAEHALATSQIVVEREQQLRKAAQRRADFLEEELSRVEVHPDGARARVLARWRDLEADLSAKPAASSVSDEEAPGPATVPGQEP